jgi:hypothetical protein
MVRETGPTRRAMIEGFSEPIYSGVHWGIKRFYQVEPDQEQAATVEHITAATARLSRQPRYAGMARLEPLTAAP